MECLQFLVWMMIIFCGVESKKSYEGYKLMSVVPKTDAQVEILSKLWTENRNLSLDFWSNPAQSGHKVDIAVPPSSVTKFQAVLTENGIKTDVVIEDIETAITLDEEVIKDHAQFAPMPKKRGAGGFSLHEYNTYDRVVQYLQDVAQEYPNFTKLITLQDESGQMAKTHEGRKLYVLKIGSSKKSNKPAYWLDSGIHAREWAASAMTPIIIDDLVTKYGKDDTITKYIDGIDFYIMPFVNPDGYEYSRTTDRMWRKNRRDNGDRCYGVDLNRNWDSVFGGAGTSGDPCNLIYRGPAAFSEPENMAMKVFLESIKGNLQAFVTAHAYSQMWFYPYASRKNFEPENKDEVRALANAAAKKLKSMYGTEYTVGTPANILYAATGGSMDWVKESLGTRYVFGLELRPLSSRIGFMLPERYIEPTAVETWEGLKVVAEELLNPGSLTSGGSTEISNNCSDRDQRNCRRYRRAGYCNYYVYEHHMETYCAKTCGFC